MRRQVRCRKASSRPRVARRRRAWDSPPRRVRTWSASSAHVRSAQTQTLRTDRGTILGKPPGGPLHRLPSEPVTRFPGTAGNLVAGALRFYPAKRRSIYRFTWQAKPPAPFSVPHSIAAPEPGNDTKPHLRVDAKAPVSRVAARYVSSLSQPSIQTILKLSAASSDAAGALFSAPSNDHE
jgi:hypothetical protein